MKFVRLLCPISNSAKKVTLMFSLIYIGIYISIIAWNNKGIANATDMTSELTLQVPDNYDPTNYVNAQSTFRIDMWQENSCQYQKANYMNSLNNPYILGVGSGYWFNSTKCGQCLLIRNNDNGIQTIGIIADYCPKCAPFQLDMSQHLASVLNFNMRPINHHNLIVSEIDCEFSGDPPMKIHVYQTSNNWVLYLNVLFAKSPILSLKIGNLTAYHDNFGRWVAEIRGKYGNNTVRNLTAVVTREQVFSPDYRQIMSYKLPFTVQL